MNNALPELPAFLDRRHPRSETVPSGNAATRSAVVHEISKMDGLEFHELANCFPLMEGAEYDALVSDVREHGQRDPIVIHNRKILDGRNRFRACIDAGIIPKTVEWDGQGAPAAFVISCNIHRRHLGPSQLGMAAARIANLKLGHVGKQIAQAECGGQIFPPISNQQAADMLGVSRHTVTDSKKVLTHGTPAEIAAVDRGFEAASTLAAKIRSSERVSGGERKSSAAAQAGNRHTLVGSRLKKLAALVSEIPGDSDLEYALRKNRELATSLVNTLPTLRVLIQVVEAVATSPDF